MSISKDLQEIDFTDMGKKVSDSEEIILPDPRPDLAEDTKLWATLLRVTVGTDLHFILHGFRCVGTRLIYSQDNRTYKLQPILEDWGGQQNYNANTRKYLAPRRESLRSALLQVPARLQESCQDTLEDVPPG